MAILLDKVDFGRGHHEEQFCKIILNLDQLFRRCCSKTFLIYSSGGPFIQWSRTICVVKIEGNMRNNFMKLFKFGPVVQEMLFKRFLI